MQRKYKMQEVNYELLIKGILLPLPEPHLPTIQHPPSITRSPKHAHTHPFS